MRMVILAAILSLCYSQGFCSEVINLSFQQFDSTTTSENIPLALKQAHQHHVSIRGFLYQGSNGQWILAAEPNLKTCCIGSKDKISKQIAVTGNGLKPSSGAVLIQGEFLVAPLMDATGSLMQLYVLKNAQRLQPKTQWSLFNMVLAGIALCIAWGVVLWHKKKAH